MEKKEDLRVIKTKKALREALVELINKKLFDKISVTEICDTALINRMTFYKYFQDKKELLNHVFENLNEILLSKLRKIPHYENESNIDYIIKIIREVYLFCLENVNTLRPITNQFNLSVIKEFSRISINQIEEMIRRLSAENNSENTNPSFVAIYTYGGFGALIYNWVAHRNEISIEQVDDFLHGYKKLMTGQKLWI